MGDWKNLPHDLLPIIAHYLNTYTDYVRFRAICASWRSTLPKWLKGSYRGVPWLMLPSRTPNEKLRSFYNPVNGQVYYLELPEVRDQLYLGSSNDWLVILENGWTPKLFNPLTRSQLSLPPISNYDTNRHDSVRIHKMVLSFSITLNDFIAVIIYDGLSLAFTKFGDHKWTLIPTGFNIFRDCIILDGKIYVLNYFGDLLVSFIGNPTRVVNMRVKSPNLSHLSKCYLVSQDNELLMVERIFKLKVNEIGDERCWMYNTVGFNLYRLDWIGETATWLNINDLDGYTLFLGLNTSVCISSKYCLELKGNQIYYAHDRMEFYPKGFFGCHDFGIFDIADGSCRNLLNYDDLFNLFLFPWHPPVWVMLNPH